MSFEELVDKIFDEVYSEYECVSNIKKEEGKDNE